MHSDQRCERPSLGAQGSAGLDAAGRSTKNKAESLGSVEGKPHPPVHACRSLLVLHVSTSGTQTYVQEGPITTCVVPPLC